MLGLYHVYLRILYKTCTGSNEVALYAHAYFLCVHMRCILPVLGGGGS